MTSVTDWSNQQPFVVTAEHLALPWRGRRGERARECFSCGFCFHRFEVGDTARWVCIDGTPNIFVCTEHDGPDVAERFKERWKTVILPILKHWSGDYD